MTSNTPPDSTRFFACPLCGKVGDPSKLVKDERWSNPVHKQCVDALESWPSAARDPLGREGSDTRWEDA